MTELQQEKSKLSSTISTIEEVLGQENEDLKSLYDTFIGSNDDLLRLINLKKNHISNLEKSLQQPYFARIDFKSDENGSYNKIYIGKNGVSKDTEIVVTDWRAPISSLYYDSDVGKCSFEAPMGIVSGELELKRQYEIENGELLNYFDVNLVTSDNLLQKYLNSNNDSRLKSIVATIQKEQNDVIRKKLFENIIVQGVAGSGKTTVALHRIAYIVYNYINNISQSQYLVIGPNPVFIKYIKSVLPELDVSEVTQYTFEQFAQDYIDEDTSVNSSEKKINRSIAGKNKNDIDKFKSSMQYKMMIDSFMDLFINSLTSKDLCLGDFKVLSSEVIKQAFLSTQSNYNSGLQNRIENTIELICKYIESHNESILKEYNDYSYEIFTNCISDDDKKKFRIKFGKDRDEIKKNCKSTVRKYFSRVKTSPTKIYKLFISSITDFNFFDYKYINDLKKETLLNLKAETVDFEDLSAIIYIKSLIAPNSKYSKMKHVVVDEAQDLGEFNFFVLKKVLPSATFSIFGDLAQSIYDYRGINSWELVNEIMFNNEAQIINFGKSYRTTSEIMEAADEISDSIGLGKSDVVIRHGNPVSINSVSDESEIPEYIARKIVEYKEKGYKTIAVISKTGLLSSYINDDLADLGLKIPNVSINDDLTNNGFQVCTISNQLAKGLEFDAVIINNASEQIYSSNNSLDMKLLYVAVTRALHELDVVYTGELTKPLNSLLKKNKNNVLKRIK